MKFDKHPLFYYIATNMAAIETYQAQRSRELGFEEGVGKRYSREGIRSFTRAAQDSLFERFYKTALNPAAKEVINIAEHEAQLDPLRGGSDLRYIGTEHLYLGLLQLPRQRDPKLGQFLDRFIPVLQEERIQTAFKQRERVREFVEGALGARPNSSEPNTKPYTLDHHSVPAVKYAHELAERAGRTRITPLDLLGGVILYQDGSGSNMFFEMADRENSYYRRLFQASRMADTNEELLAPFLDAVKSLALTKTEQEDQSALLAALLEKPQTEEERRHELAEDLWYLVPSATKKHPERGDSANFSFEGIARMLKIPRNEWDLPLVRDYVGMINTARQFGYDLGHLKSTYQEAHEQGATGPLNGTIEDRFKFTDAMLDIVFGVLKDGYSDNSRPFSEIVNRNLSDFGLEVVEKKKDPSEIQSPITFM